MLKRLTGPFRTFFNVRFVALSNSLQTLEAEVDALRVQVSQVNVDEARLADSVSEVVTREVGISLDTQHSDFLGVAGLLGRSIDQAVDGMALLMDRTTSESNESVDKLSAATHAAIEQKFDLQTHGSVAQLDSMLSDVANYASSHQGWASQSGLWFNPAISVAHAPGGLHVADINERVAEIPFVFAAMGALPQGSRILDVGSTESTVSISLASLGYRVTAVDPRPYPLEHENLTIHIGAMETFTDEIPYDAAILLSSIEHFGLGAYDLPVNENADLEAIRRVRDLVRPGGMLILTTPYGDAATTELERTYSPEQLDALLEGWTVVERTYLTQVSATEWHRVDRIAELQGSHVVLVQAMKTQV